jgi:FMN phosphatase YigB (HAD superfamily)
MRYPEGSRPFTPAKLAVFDMDGTLVQEPKYYRGVYSGSLEQTAFEIAGQRGLDEINFCRTNFEGKGELALARLGIPFSEWGKRLVAAPVDLITPQPTIVEKFRTLEMAKVLFTGSPLAMAMKILDRVGFDPLKDFDLLIGWQEPETEPAKWAQSRRIFQDIIQQMKVDPIDAWSIGDNWETDLAPAQALGLTTVQIERTTGQPDYRYPNISAFIDAYQSRQISSLHHPQ